MITVKDLLLELELVANMYMCCKRDFFSLLSKFNTRQKPVKVETRMMTSCNVSSILRQTALTSVKRGFVEDQSVLNVVAAVAHYGHSGILTSRQLFKVDQLNGFCFDHGPLRIRQQIHQSVNTVPLVVTNSTW